MQYDIIRIVNHKDAGWDLDICHLEYLDEKGQWVVIKDSESVAIGRGSIDLIKQQARSLLEYDE